MMRKLIASITAVLLLNAGAAMAAASNDAPRFLADRHANYGVECKGCHGKNNEFVQPDKPQCIACHDVKHLVQKTEPKEQFQQNPHFSPHYADRLACSNCHRGHSTPVDYCSSCHQFGFNVK